MRLWVWYVPFVYKTIPSTFLGEVDVCELYYWLASVSVGHPAGALAITCHWVLLTWLIYALWDALSRWCSSWRVFTPPMCMPISFGLGASTHVCSQSIPDCYIIKRHVSHAWYGCWTIKALIEAEVLYDGFSVSCGCIAAPLIIARPLGVSLLISYYKTSIKPI